MSDTEPKSRSASAALPDYVEPELRRAVRLGNLHLRNLDDYCTSWAGRRRLDVNAVKSQARSLLA